MDTASGNKKYDNKMSLSVDPGICGFTCTVTATQTNKRAVRVDIIESKCQQIQLLSQGLSGEISLKQLFLPLTRNPVYLAAEKAGCHFTCTLPAAILKAVEAAMGMALPKTVSIVFGTPENEKGSTDGK